jgi:hypothetical protein
MKMQHLLTLAAGVLLVSMFLPRTASAQQTMATGGNVSGTQKVLSSIELPDGRTIRRIMFSVGVTADDPASPWHLGSQDCFATYMFAADGSLIGGRGVCDFVSTEGDLWWLTLEASGDDPIRWTGLGGTGKFAGVDHSGTTVMKAEWGDGKVIGRWEGTMTRK